MLNTVQVFRAQMVINQSKGLPVIEEQDVVKSILEAASPEMVKKEDIVKEFQERAKKAGPDYAVTEAVANELVTHALNSLKKHNLVSNDDRRGYWRIV